MDRCIHTRQMTISASHRLPSVEFTTPLNGLLDTQISYPMFFWIVFVRKYAPKNRASNQIQHTSVPT
jgi:hypothetical protein